MSTNDSSDASTFLELADQAAQRGDASAQFNLGRRYTNGDGVTMDKSQAVMWYRVAADQGHSGGQFNLGLMYSRGDGVEQDNAKAVGYLTLAAQQGHPDAAATAARLSG